MEPPPEQNPFRWNHPQMEPFWMHTPLDETPLDGTQTDKHIWNITFCARNVCILIYQFCFGPFAKSMMTQPLSNLSIRLWKVTNTKWKILYIVGLHLYSGIKFSTSPPDRARRKRAVLDPSSVVSSSPSAEDRFRVHQRFRRPYVTHKER